MRLEQLECPLVPHLTLIFVTNVVTICTAWINNTDITLCHTVYLRLYCTTLTQNSDCFAIEHWPVGVLTEIVL